MFKHELGVEAKDQITGMKGIIVGRCEHLYGCNTYGLAPKVLKDGKRLDVEWFDEGRLIITGRGINPKKVQADRPGADASPKLK